MYCKPNGLSQDGKLPKRRLLEDAEQVLIQAVPGIKNAAGKTTVSTGCISVDRSDCGAWKWEPHCSARHDTKMGTLPHKAFYGIPFKEPLKPCFDSERQT